MAIKLAINGFGRIGRLVFRAACTDSNFDIMAINDLTTPEMLAHLLKYDSVHGRFDGEVSHDEGALVVNGKTIKVLSERDPANLPWKEMGVETVVESTGLFTQREAAAKHIEAGAGRVVISAPAKNPDVTVVLGVNDDAIDKDNHKILSNASCTTNCLGPVAKVLLDTFGIKRGLMTTIHAYTNDQMVQDLPHKDMRRARAAAVNMIPTTTGAARAIGEVLPVLKGKLDGMAVRVPTVNVSMVDLVVETEKPASVDDVNAAMKKAAEGPMKGILQYVDEPLVSTDFLGDSHSSSFDSLATMSLEGNMIKVVSWYDNEWGYASRVVDLVRKLHS